MLPLDKSFKSKPSSTRVYSSPNFVVFPDLYGYNTGLYYLSEHMAYMKVNNNMSQTQVADAMVDALLKSAPDREIFLEEDDEVKGMFKSIGVGINFENNTYYMVIHLAG